MILIIDNYDSFTYNLYQAVAQLYSQVKVVRNDQITLSEIYQLAPQGVILSPGPGRPENAGICIELIQNYEPHIPMLGVCLGHQAMTIAFGGKVIQAPEIVHGKPECIFHQRKGLYQHLPLPFQAARYHSLMADPQRLPKNFVVEAVNAEGLIMGMRHIERPMYGVQFHPESILTPAGEILLKNFVNQCVDLKEPVLC